MSFKHIKTREDFIARAISIHGDKYDYSKVKFPKREALLNWQGKKTRKPPEYYREAKVIIVCPIHGEFLSTARKHIEKNGSGCPRCARELNSKVRYNDDGVPTFIDANPHEIQEDCVVVSLGDKGTCGNFPQREVLISGEDIVVLEYTNWWITGFQKSRRSRTLYCIGSPSVRLNHEGITTPSRGTSIHRVIMSRIVGRPLLKSEHVDHINGNGLDNRRSNLRIATPSQNAANMRKQSKRKNSSVYKGVCHDKRKNQWMAYVGSCSGGITKREYLGRWSKTPENEILAAKAYDKRAKELWGEFAHLNFPDDS
jgi:hypothetical protein